MPGADEVQEQEGRVKPYAPDLRSGHFYVDAFGSAVFPVGSFAPNTYFSDVASYGFMVGGGLGIGLSRYAELDARGGWGLMTGPGDCASCASDVAMANLGITYHLAQGAAFDAWIRYGVGYRSFSIEHSEDESPRVLNVVNGRYHGIDIAALTLGAEFFPVRGFGFGPWFEADLGTFAAWPDESARGTRIYGFFQIGLNIEVDPVMWFTPANAGQPVPAPTSPKPTDPTQPAAPTAVSKATPASVTPPVASERQVPTSQKAMSTEESGSF